MSNQKRCTHSIIFLFLFLQLNVIQAIAPLYHHHDNHRVAHSHALDHDVDHHHDMDELISSSIDHIVDDIQDFIPPSVNDVHILYDVTISKDYISTYESHRYIPFLSSGLNLSQNLSTIFLFSADSSPPKFS